MPKPRKAVFLTEEFPFPPDRGGKLRDSSVLLCLLEHMPVTLVCFSRSGISPEVVALAGKGLQTHVIQRDRNPWYIRMWSPLRPYILNGYSQRVEEQLRSLASPGTILWLSRLAMAKYLPLGQQLGYQVILDEHNVESDLLLGPVLDRPRRWLEVPLALQCRWLESRFCSRADHVIATSARDAGRLKKLSPQAEVRVLPNTIETAALAPLREEAGTSLFFSGTLDYQPNIEALHWFLDSVLPLLKSRLASSEGRGLPEVVVAGAHPSESLRVRLEAAGVRLVANPASMTPLLRNAAVVMVPLLSGSGTRLKIIEAFAAGRAVVSTTKGAEGLDAENGVHLALADSPEEFAGAIAALLQDPARRQELGKRAVKLAEERYDRRILVPMMERLLESMASRRGGPGE